MTQAVPIDAYLGLSKTGLAIGSTIYQLDGTTSFAAFSAAGWYEAPAGTGDWHHAGINFPDVGGVIAIGISGTEYKRQAIGASVYNRIGAPAGASIAADIAAIEVETSNIQTRIPAGLVSGRIDANVGSMTAGVITAAAIATNAIDADAIDASAVSEIAAGVAATGAPTVADIDTQLSSTHGSGSWLSPTGFATPADVSSSTSSINGSISALNNLSAAQVWSYATRLLTAGGDSAAIIWAYALRTLTSPTPGSTQPPVIVGGTLSITKAVSFDVTITGMVIPSNWSKVYFTVKTGTGIADSASTIQIVKTNGGDAGDGLLYINGAASGALAQGTMTIDQPGGNATISITDDETSLITAGGYIYDLKVITSASKSTVLASGTANVGATPTVTV